MPPTNADNLVTWDRVVMVAAFVAGLDIDFAGILLAKIHEQALKTFTTYLFPCRYAGMLQCRSNIVINWCKLLEHWISA